MSGASDLAHTLEPHLLEVCEGRLSDVHWFSSDWQRGGSATGRAQYRDGERELDVIVKLPVEGNELHWTANLGTQEGGPVPRVLASGQSLNGDSVGWLVIEQVTGQSVASDPSAKHVRLLLEAAAEMQVAAERLESPAHAPKPPDWAEIIDRSRDAAHRGALPEAQHWNVVLKNAQKLLPELARKWLVRPINTWCHGDLHPGNGIIVPDDSRCRLIDLGLVHAGHWVEDALALERLFWGHLDKLGKTRPVSTLARARRKLGADNGPDHTELVAVKRALIAACVPANVAHEDDPAYLRYALGILEDSLSKIT